MPLNEATKDIKKKAKSRKSKNAIKKNASKSRKCDKISTQNTGKVDTEFYEVQDIVRSRIEGREIQYTVKWTNWNGGDTEEAERRLVCTEKLMGYAARTLKSSYVTNLDFFLRNLDTALSDLVFFTNTLIPLSIVAEATVFGSSVKFVTRDNIGAKIMYLKYIKEHNQMHLLHSFLVPQIDRVNSSHIQYDKEMKYQRQIFEDYPFVKIFYPTKKQSVLFPPPPLPNILFEPVTEEMYKNRENFPHFFPRKGIKAGFNNVRPFIDRLYFAKDESQQPKYLKEVDENKYEGMRRINKAVNSRFSIPLEMRQEPGSGWYILSAMYSLPNVPLMVMTGVIRPAEVARESLRTEGKEVAFSSFVEIPGTDLCLDRREFYDFSKFIPHSCNPTCNVRLVESGNDIPDLVIYSRFPLDEGNGYVITLDYFKAFKKEVEEYFSKVVAPDGKLFHLLEKDIDFVQCKCEHKCREIVYIDQSAKKKSEKEKLTSTFNGMSLVESPKIWKIKNGNFLE